MGEEIRKALMEARGPMNDLALNLGILLLIMLTGGFLAGFIAKALRLPNQFISGVICLGIIAGIYFWAQTPLAL
ncbi:hypothetical protein [Virgibacillus sediminis]|uniref:Uncharacterized protein n=1 Tax=Virgibacillus sediminis TaxID=202260 RepID=A0ABV7A641_9BACI